MTRKVTEQYDVCLQLEISGVTDDGLAVKTGLLIENTIYHFHQPTIIVNHNSDVKHPS